MRPLLTLAVLFLAVLPLAGQTPAGAPPADTSARLGPIPPAPAGRTLSLWDALELAERQSESVGLARSDIDRALGLRRQARSGYFPQLSGSASYTRTLRSQFSPLADDTTTGTGTEAPSECARFAPNPALSVEERLDSLERAVECASTSNPFAAFRDLPFGRENTYRFGLSASQTLFSGGRVGGQVASANAGLRSAELGLTGARAQTLLDVTQAYYDAALGDRLVAIARATLDQADTTLSQTALGREVGNLSEFELLRARVTRDNQRPIVIQREADREQSYDRLKQLLNLPLADSLALTTALGDSTRIEAPQLSAVLETIADTTSSGRVPVRQAAEAVTAQQGALRVARSQRLPQLVLSSDFADIAFPASGSPFGTDYVADWTVSVALSLPLFTGGRIKGQVESARADLVSAELRLQQTRERSELEARNAATQLRAAVAAWAASAGTEEQARRAYDIAEVRYREGISTQTELNDQRIQLSVAQATRARAARDLQVARVRLALLPALPLAGQSAAPGTTTTSAASAPTTGSGVLVPGTSAGAQAGIPGQSGTGTTTTPTRAVGQ